MKRLRFSVSLMTLFSMTAYAGAATMNTQHLALSLMSYFGIGVLLAFTPCVLPMVPILSSILIGQQTTTVSRSFKLSLVFVLSMAATYAVAGMLAGYLGSTLQTVMQVPWVIVGFSLVFVVMAMSMFGWLQVSLPRFIQQPIMRMNQDMKGGGYVGVALMGVFSTLIASPCVTPPLIAILTYIGQSGNTLMGGLALFTLALGMGLPLLLVGVGQGALLPKTGAWMTHIKSFFGIVMLGLAIWMLSRLFPDNLMSSVWAAPAKPAQSVAAVVSPGQLFSNVMSLDDLNEKLAAAKEKHQPVMIEFFASWCPACKALDKEVLSDVAIQKPMQGFANYRVDLTTKNDELMQIVSYYQVYGTPSVVFYDKNGERVMTDAFDDGITKNGLLSVFKQIG